MKASDLAHLRRCVALAETAVGKGHQPFGSILVAADGRVLFEGHNETGGGDRTRHPEFALARWAATSLPPEARAAATVYTSGEHCPMCAAAHGWVGLGRIVYAASSAQLMAWLEEFGAPPPPVSPLPITEILPDALVEGPAPELADEIRALHRRSYEAQLKPSGPRSAGRTAKVLPPTIAEPRDEITLPPPRSVEEEHVMASVDVEMVKCACADCVCVVSTEKSVQRDGKAFCCDECADGHKHHDGCHHAGCKCHG